MGFFCKQVRSQVSDKTALAIAEHCRNCLRQLASLRGKVITLIQAWQCCCGA